jgi:hypothetical protein
MYSGKNFAVERLTQAECKRKDVVLVNAVVFGGDWSLSAPLEVAVPRNMEMRQLYEKLSVETKVALEVISVAKATDAVTALDAPQLDYDPKIPKFIKNAKVPSNTVCTAPFWLKDGDLVVVKDRTEEMEELTDEKIRQLKGFKK